MMSNYSRNIRIVFFVVAIAGIALTLSPVHVNAVPPKRPPVTCPCNFDLEFWTRHQWVLTDNGLFDRCLFAPTAVTQLTGDSSNGEVTCESILVSQLVAPPPLPQQSCIATIGCSGLTLAGIDIFDQLEEITVEEHLQCSNDILAIADSVNIICD